MVLGKEPENPNNIVYPATADVRDFFSPFDSEILDGINQIELGAFWILQAIVLAEINDGTINKKTLTTGLDYEYIFKKHNSRLEEMWDLLFLAQELSTLIKGHAIIYSFGLVTLHALPENQMKKKTYDFFCTYLSDLTQETLKAKDRIKKNDIVMVAGQQGVGKTAVTNFFKLKGYEIVSMSQIVREMIQAWGLDPNETIDKIVGGQIAKDYFGPDILVQLAVHYLVSIGKTKIVIDGPRLVEEAQAVIDFGGRLIGVVASKDEKVDEQIRLERITQRAEEEPSRAGDVINFPKRETIEAEKINSILKMVKPENLIVNEGITKDNLIAQLESLVA